MDILIRKNYGICCTVWLRLHMILENLVNESEMYVLRTYS